MPTHILLQQSLSGNDSGSKSNSNQSNRSFDELSRLGEEESGAEESIGGTHPQHKAHLKRTVDDLTEKCQRSIELLRLCSRNHLSPSVENLLESVIVVEEDRGSGSVNESSMTSMATNSRLGPAGTPETGEGLTERLERLSSAFDAIQKYLEEQSSGPRGTGGSSSLSPPSIHHSRTTGNGGPIGPPSPSNSQPESSMSRLLSEMANHSDKGLEKSSEDK